MGNDQSRSSSSTDDHDAPNGQPPDYYQLLQVTEDATAEDIKVGRVYNLTWIIGSLPFSAPIESLLSVANALLATALKLTHLATQSSGQKS